MGARLRRPQWPSSPPLMARRLFGTDGVRGVAGELLTADLALQLGRAATLQSGADSAAAASSSSATRARAARCSRRRSRPASPRPAATSASAASCRRPRRRCCSAATASTSRRSSPPSHNPYRDNGIKFFGADGFKLSDETEEAIEALLDDEPSTADAHRPDPGAARHRGGLPARAAHALRRPRPRRASTSCWTAPTARPTPRRPRSSGAWARTSPSIADAPDGRNINEGCGSTHVDALAQQVVDGGHDVGFAFDGDGDRVLAVDRNGVVVDGDELIALAALHLRDAGPPAGRRRRGDRDDELRLPLRDARARHRGRDDAGRRPLRARGAAGARLGARRRAVRPHHRHGLRAQRRRHRQRAARARVARGRRPRRARRDEQAARSGSSTCSVADRDAAMGSDEVAAGRRARPSDALEGRGRVLVRPSGHRAARARDGRGARRRRGRRRLCTARCGRRAIRPAPLSTL